MPSDTTAPPDGGATSSTADAGGQTPEQRNAFLEAEARKAYEARDAAKARVRELEAHHKTAQQEEAKRAAESGQWKEAYDKLLAQWEEAAPRLKELETLAPYFGERVDAALAALPEDLRDAIPSHLSAVDKLRLAEKLTAHTTKKPAAPPVPQTPGPTGGGTQPPYGTPEYLEWQRKAPIEEVREARRNWRDRLMGRVG